MQVTLELPDDIAQQFQDKDGDISRGLLRALALEGYRTQELTHAQVTRLLGLQNRLETDAFLKAHGVFLEYTDTDQLHDRETNRLLRGRSAP